MNQFHFKPLTLGLLTASVLTLAGLGLFASRTQAADAPKAAAAPKAALTVSTVQAKSSQLPVKLSANGGVAAWQEASVGSEASGLRVAELHAGVGDSVKRGQVLATFASESVQADVALARASLNEAQANAAEALANGDRARAVQGTGAVSAQQINQYLTQEATAKARVASAQAQLDAQLLRLKQTQLLAPDSGIISARSASVGSVVGAGTEMFKLIRQGRLEWRGEVTSAEFARIKPGMTVLVTSPGGVQAKGKVRMLAPTVDAATRNGLVYVDLLAASTAGQSLGGAFKPGMYARGEFELGSTGALTVPQAAVVVRDGFSYVYRVGSDNRVSQLKVQTGRVVGEQIEIQSGVKPEDKLVASGGSFLSEGDTVKVVDAADSKPKSAVAPVAPAQAATK
ncbi:efflux RND transporter periplasmic adaptor subunit [Rhodoferax sp. TBRC 17660]|uniref:Efflux RND transporter periplasmic adaptor subunit n=1 Tax=Rhodoferax potami TaxID=3068338 RepID=A0ABU3KQI2_9BURK|nr:efflux RND transporter periplasmic adaptor subunit [Rhodoferax sp. TBRC 17660]MDT7520017.1 efflux RND transporter periplasmic adaptor subunit [Rhodoferax sp. TBRC 17660]